MSSTNGPPQPFSFMTQPKLIHLFCPHNLERERERDKERVFANKVLRAGYAIWNVGNFKGFPVSVSGTQLK